MTPIIQFNRASILNKNGMDFKEIDKNIGIVFILILVLFFQIKANFNEVAYFPEVVYIFLMLLVGVSYGIVLAVADRCGNASTRPKIEIIGSLSLLLIMFGGIEIIKGYYLLVWLISLKISTSFFIQYKHTSIEQRRVFKSSKDDSSKKTSLLPFIISSGFFNSMLNTLVYTNYNSIFGIFRLLMQISDNFRYFFPIQTLFITWGALTNIDYYKKIGISYLLFLLIFFGTSILLVSFDMRFALTSLDYAPFVDLLNYGRLVLFTTLLSGLGFISALYFSFFTNNIKSFILLLYFGLWILLIFSVYFKV